MLFRSGAFGYELDLEKLSEEELAQAKAQTEFYRKHGELFHKGRYYRLSSPFENRDFTAWSYVSQDQAKVLLSVVFTDLNGNPKTLRIRLKGLDAGAVYVLEGKEYTGAALMQAGLVLPVPKCDYDAWSVLLEKQ